MAFTEKLSVIANLMSPDKRRRYLARWRVAAKVAEMADTRVQEAFLTWHEDPDFDAIWQGTVWHGNVGMDARKFTLVSIARSVRHIPGDTAECGTYDGIGSHAILKAMSQPDRPHRIFDSFEGLTDPDEVDTAAPGVSQLKKGEYSCPEDIARKMLAPYPNVHFYRGWIPERFPEVEDRRFALVHVDVDLYQATLDSHEFFYPRMSPGGIVVCDDYGFASCPGAKRAVDEFAEKNGMSPIVLPTGQSLLIKAGS